MRRRRGLDRRIEAEAPEHTEAEELLAVAYVRPHDIHVHRIVRGEGAIAAHLAHYLGWPVVRLELMRDDSDDKELIEVKICRERFRELQLTQGDQVFIKPSRFNLFPVQIH